MARPSKTTDPDGSKLGSKVNQADLKDDCLVGIHSTVFSDTAFK